MKNKSEILKIIKDIKEDFKKRYKVKGMGIFGSLVKGEQKEGSDIDILVDFEEDADIFDLVGLGRVNRRVNRDNTADLFIGIRLRHIMKINLPPFISYLLPASSSCYDACFHCKDNFLCDAAQSRKYILISV